MTFSMTSGAMQAPPWASRLTPLLLDPVSREKLVLDERLAKTGQPQRSFDEMFELALAFLANPWHLWKSERYADKRTVLRLVFADRLAYCRSAGFRTPKTSIIFNALEEYPTMNALVAERESAKIDSKEFSHVP